MGGKIGIMCMSLSKSLQYWLVLEITTQSQALWEVLFAGLDSGLDWTLDSGLDSGFWTGLWTGL